MRVSPCKGCKERKEGCHSRCDHYKDWKDDLEQEKANKNKVMSIESSFAKIYESRTKAEFRRHKKGHRK